ADRPPTSPPARVSTDTCRPWPDACPACSATAQTRSRTARRACSCSAPTAHRPKRCTAIRAPGTWWGSRPTAGISCSPSSAPRTTRSSTRSRSPPARRRGGSPPAGRTVRRRGAPYSAAGGRVFVAAAEEGRPATLLALDRETGRAAARYEETAIPTGTIDPDVSPTGDWVAIAVDAGNHSEVRILDARTLRLHKTVATGHVAAGLGPFRADGESFGLTLSRPDAPTDLHAVGARTGEGTPLPSAPRPGRRHGP